VAVDQITEAQLVAWITDARANNTVRRRLSVVRTFWRWAIKTGHATHDRTADLDYLTRQYPKTYGKVQASHPARWLSADEAARLTAACQTGTVLGLRDELIIRLGLLGMRNAEIRNLRIGDFHLNLQPPEIRWTGKGRRPRSAQPGPSFVRTLDAYLAHWSGTPAPTDYVICAAPKGRTQNTHAAVLRWGVPIASGHQVAEIVTRRAESVGLGHVTTHDLRRSAAGILHNAKTDDGGHLFDLLDIQRVLGHADPATTQRSYLDPIDHGVIGRAGAILD
jgi:integrase